MPVQAFYEPCYEGGGKPVRWSIHRTDGLLFALAAIWERWKPESDEHVLSCSLLTVNADASPLMRRFHGPDDEKRSVVAVRSDQYGDWLDAEDDVAARAMLQPIVGGDFTTTAAPRSRPAMT